MRQVARAIRVGVITRPLDGVASRDLVLDVGVVLRLETAALRVADPHRGEQGRGPADGEVVHEEVGGPGLGAHPPRPNSLIRLLSLLVISSMMYATLAGITWCPAAAALYFQTVCPVACATMLVTGMGLCWTPRSPSVAAPSARSSSVMPHVRDPSVAAHWVGDGQLTCVLPLMTQFWLSEVTPMASSVFAMYCVPVA